MTVTDGNGVLRAMVQYVQWYNTMIVMVQVNARYIAWGNCYRPMIVRDDRIIFIRKKKTGKREEGRAPPARREVVPRLFLGK